MLERSFTVRNKAGIHCRPSGVILNTISSEFSDTKVTITNSEGTTVEVNSILSLISLGLHKDSTAIVRVEGGKEEEALARIGDLLEFEFDYPMA
jgi:phosphocarrier protein